MDVKITVIIPAYNVAEWLPRCIDSVLQQTYQNLEIIVVDDGSTDDTPAIIDGYAKKDSRVVAVHQRNAGLVAVRERGISMAHGQYVGFVDGDDEVACDMFERLLHNALKYNADISQCGILYCFYDGRKKPMHGTEQLHIFNRLEGCRELFDGTRMEPSLCNKLYKKELLKDSCIDMTVTNNEDLLRNAVLFDRAKCSVFEDFCGYHYWRRAESMSNNDKAVPVSRDVLKARRLILEYAPTDIKNAALCSYIGALVGAYNSMIGRREIDAKQLKRECRSTLGEHKRDFVHLRKAIRYRAVAILACSAIYDLAHKVHMKLLYARIRRSAKNAQQ